eukprot:CFRG5778T1
MSSSAKDKGLKEKQAVEDFFFILEKCQQQFNAIKDVPIYSRKLWNPFFAKAFNLYQKLWKFQQDSRSALDSSGKLKRHEIGDIASKISQLYFQYYRRTADVSHLYSALNFLGAIRTRGYFSSPPNDNKAEFQRRVLRYYVRYISILLLLHRSDLVWVIADEFACAIEDYCSILNAESTDANVSTKGGGGTVAAGGGKGAVDGAGGVKLAEDWIALYEDLSVFVKIVHSPVVYIGDEGVMLEQRVRVGVEPPEMTRTPAHESALIQNQQLLLNDETHSQTSSMYQKPARILSPVPMPLHPSSISTPGSHTPTTSTPYTHARGPSGGGGMQGILVGTSNALPNPPIHNSQSTSSVPTSSVTNGNVSSTSPSALSVERLSLREVLIVSSKLGQARFNELSVDVYNISCALELDATPENKLPKSAGTSVVGGETESVGMGESINAGSGSGVSTSVSVTAKSGKRKSDATVQEKSSKAIDDTVSANSIGRMGAGENIGVGTNTHITNTNTNTSKSNNTVSIGSNAITTASVGGSIAGTSSQHNVHTHTHALTSNSSTHTDEQELETPTEHWEWGPPTTRPLQKEFNSDLNNGASTNMNTCPTPASAHHPANRDVRDDPAKARSIKLSSVSGTQPDKLIDKALAVASAGAGSASVGAGAGLSVPASAGVSVGVGIGSSTVNSRSSIAAPASVGSVGNMSIGTGTEGKGGLGDAQKSPSSWSHLSLYGGNGPGGGALGPADVAKFNTSKSSTGTNTPTAQPNSSTTANHGTASTPSLPPPLSDPHKLILHRPTLNVLMQNISSAMLEVVQVPGAAMLVYVSADTTETSSTATKSQATIKENVNTGTDQKVGMYDRGLLLKPGDNTEVSPLQRVLCAGDIMPFTRVPLVLVIDSPEAASFQCLRSPFGAPVVCLMSPMMVPFKLDAQHGSIFTLFLSCPIKAMAAITGLTVVPAPVGRQCDKVLQDFYSRGVHLFTQQKNINNNLLWIIDDPFLRLLLLRFLFCCTVLRVCTLSMSKPEYQPSCSPPIPEQLLRHPALEYYVLEMVTKLDVDGQFSSKN